MLYIYIDIYKLYIRCYNLFEAFSLSLSSHHYINILYSLNM